MDGWVAGRRVTPVRMEAVLAVVGALEKDALRE